MTWHFKKKESSYVEGSEGRDPDIFLEVCFIQDRPWGVGWMLMFIYRWSYLLQLPSACLCIAFAKVINSLDSNLKDLLAVLPCILTGSVWVEASTNICSVIELVFMVRGILSADTFPQNIAWIGRWRFYLCILRQIRPKHLWMSYWIGISSLITQPLDAWAGLEAGWHQATQHRHILLLLPGE